MKPSVKEWVAKAEGDCVSALREFRARKCPNFEMLSQYAVLFRYPGYSADRAKGRNAIAAMTRCRSEILPTLDPTVNVGRGIRSGDRST